MHRPMKKSSLNTRAAAERDNFHRSWQSIFMFVELFPTLLCLEGVCVYLWVKPNTCIKITDDSQQSSLCLLLQEILGLILSYNRARPLMQKVFRSLSLWAPAKKRNKSLFTSEDADGIVAEV